MMDEYGLLPRVVQEKGLKVMGDEKAKGREEMCLEDEERFAESIISHGSNGRSKVG
jgi:hypothetical protein